MANLSLMQKRITSEKAASVKTDVWVVGNAGATATAQLLWDEKYLYVLADVKDPLRSKLSSNAHEQDSIEIFINRAKIRQHSIRRMTPSTGSILIMRLLLVEMHGKKVSNQLLD